MSTNMITIQNNYVYNLASGKCWETGLPSDSKIVSTGKCYYALVGTDGDQRLWFSTPLVNRGVEMFKFPVFEKVNLSEQIILSAFLNKVSVQKIIFDDQIIINMQNEPCKGLFPCQPSDSYLMIFKSVTENSLFEFKQLHDESVGRIMEHGGFMIWEYQNPTRLYCNFKMNKRYGIESLLQPSDAHNNISEVHFGKGFLAIRCKSTNISPEYVAIIVLSNIPSSAPLPKINHYHTRELPLGSTFLKIYHIPAIAKLKNLYYDMFASSIFYHGSEPLIYDNALRKFKNIRTILSIEKETIIQTKKMNDCYGTYYSFFVGNRYFDTRGLMFETFYPNFFQERILWARRDKLALSGDRVPVRASIGLQVFFPNSKEKENNKRSQIYRYYYDIYGNRHRILNCRLLPSLFSHENLDTQSSRIHGYHEKDEDDQSTRGMMLSFSRDRIIYRATKEECLSPLSFFLKVIEDYLSLIKDQIIPAELWIVPDNMANHRSSFEMMNGALMQFYETFFDPVGDYGTRFKEDICQSISLTDFDVFDYYGHLISIFLRQYSSPLPFHMPITFFSRHLKNLGIEMTAEIVEYFSVMWKAELNIHPSNEWMETLSDKILSILEISKMHPVDLDYHLSGSYPM
jgi:hypothetical protein